MSRNTFGTHFRITTWGESHGKEMGVVIDGCPSGLPLTESLVQHYVDQRAPGHSRFTSPRREPDRVEIVSGLFEGKTTGAPITLRIENRDVDSRDYEKNRAILRPSHATYTYLKKYGHFDFRGGGRASARETVCRVAAGAVAQELLKCKGIVLVAYIKEIGGITAEVIDPFLREESPLRCPDIAASLQMELLLEEVIEAGDSVGGVVECQALHLPVGLGSPLYEKMDAKLAFAMLSIPAARGFEMGMGFAVARLRGSLHNDTFKSVAGDITLASNHAGGTLGGITTGMPLIFRVAFKPTSSIKIPQQSVTIEGEEALFMIGKEARHDPCVAIRAVAVVQAMGALCIADALLAARGDHLL